MTEIVSKNRIKEDKAVEDTAPLLKETPTAVVSGRQATTAEIAAQQAKLRTAQAAERKAEREAMAVVRKQLAAAKKT